MMIKRSREGTDLEDIRTVANFLILLSGSHGSGSVGGAAELGRVFECKTCNRQFPSFQALGGHRASHKKMKLTVAGDEQPEASPPKPKSHECAICGLEFQTGQALGGHMRRHRSAAAVDDQNPASFPLITPPIVKKSNSRRVVCLDLNLTPLENYKFAFGNVAPAIDCLF